MCASFPPTPNSCLIPFPSLIVVCITTASRGWTAAQILTPILVGIILCLAFALWFLYYTGRLSRLTYILYSMRRSRPQRHRWTIDNDDPSGGALHHGPDAEALPMINPVLHWRSLSLNDDATNHKRYNARMGMGALTPVLSKGISSIRRLFGRGPVKVSRAPVSDTFDLEDPVSEADPFDTHGSSTSSRSWRNGPPIVERNSGSTLDRIPSPHDLINKLSWSSTAPESVPDNGQENYENTGNVSESGGGETDHDHEVDAGNGVMLISRDGENFSLSGSMISVPIGSSRRSVEVDRGSIEVVPPSPPAVSSKQVSKSVGATRDHLNSSFRSLSATLALQEVHLRPIFAPLPLKSLASVHSDSPHPPMTYPTSVCSPFQNLLSCHPHISPRDRPRHRVVCNPLARMRLALAYTSSRQRHRP